MKSTRREFIQSLGAGSAGLSLASPLLFSSCAAPDVKNDGQVLFIGDNIAVAETINGKVRGYILRDIYYFLGIPYGADTSGSNRFIPPKKPDPWNDIFPAIWWGNGAPQLIEGIYSGNNRYRAFMHHANFDDLGENCLSINVFTPGYHDAKKRPVLLWMHGGAWNYGISHEHDGVNGENLARYGDIVFCSINHRLGPLGFSDFSAIGNEKYASSGNVGALDLVAALEWIRDNIANFGGDPDNVTIIGQSGGGGKVVTTASMLPAKGLFGKAVVLSAADMELRNKEMTMKVGEYILKEAGIKAFQIDKLQQLPWRTYYDIALRAAEKFIKESGTESVSAMKIFQPQVDGNYIPYPTFYPVASPVMADIPMIISSTTNESSNAYRDSSLEEISYQGVKDELIKTYGKKAGEIVDAYAKAFPDKKPVEIWSMASRFRQGSVLLADAKSKQSPPVYLSWFGWQPPLFDNRMRAFHTLDQCFWFYNTDVMLTHTGGGARPRSLSEKMANSLIQFMKTGDPNGGGLPEWPRYTSDKGEMMFLDNVCEVQNDPDREARNMLPPYIPQLPDSSPSSR
jgi:para-nitrobenzyl esterase